MGQITNLSNTTFLDNVKKGITAAKLRAVHDLIDTELEQKTSEILRPFSIVRESLNSLLEVANPYPSNTLAAISIYKQVYVNGVATEVGYEQVTPTKITKNVAVQGDKYSIEGLADGKYHVVFSPAATFIPYTV